MTKQGARRVGLGAFDSLSVQSYTSRPMDPDPGSLPTPSDGPKERGSFAWHVLACGVAAVLILIAYAGALRGEFVYDDTLEIVRNPYIQHTRYLWRALTSDVWAFKGERDAAWSNYWRPAFVAWMTLNYRLFGLNPLGWHVTSLLAHLAATLLAYRVLIGFGVRAAVAAVATWVFAVHPVQVESVAWVSGVPNSLAAIGLFASFAAYLRLRERASAARWVAALGFYALALLSREGAVVYPAILLGTEWILRDTDSPVAPTFWRRAIVGCPPFAVLAVVFVLARFAVLGVVRIVAPGAPSVAGVLMTVPSLLAFYVRQVFVPIQLGPVYGLRAVSDANAGWWNFVLPLAGLTFAAIMLFRVARRRPGVQLGLLWACLPLVPILDIRSFVTDQLVHDRYLYLPLLGFALAAAALTAERVQRLARGRRDRADQTLAGLGLVVSLALAVATWRYAPVWANEIALWTRGVQTAPESATAFHQLGEAHRQAGHLDDARAALRRALELDADLTLANLALAALDVRERHFPAAEERLQRVLAVYPDLAAARDQLALCYQQQGQFLRAVAVFDEGRGLIPYKRLIYTVNIAVLLYQAGQQDQALAELESIAGQLDDQTEPAAIKAWWYMGELYRAAGQSERAARAYERFIAAAERSGHRELLQLAERTRHGLGPVRP